MQQLGSCAHRGEGSSCLQRRPPLPAANVLAQRFWVAGWLARHCAAPACRDIKLENIFIDSSGRVKLVGAALPSRPALRRSLLSSCHTLLLLTCGGLPMLACVQGDFGLTMSMRQESAISPVGTVEYMAPEVRSLRLVGDALPQRRQQLLESAQLLTVWSLPASLVRRWLRCLRWTWL
jgi:hypothetical protein